MDNNVYLRIGEAARIAGVSVQTLRRWEAAGILVATRSVGGQRTYRLADIKRLHDGEIAPPQAPRGQAPPPITDIPLRVSAETADTKASGVIHPWVAREANAAANLAVTRLELQRLEELRRFHAERERTAREASERKSRAAQAERAAALEVQSRKAVEDALAMSVSRIRSCLLLSDNAERADIEAFLANHAVAGVSLSWLEAEAATISDRHSARRAKERRERLEADRASSLAKAAAASATIKRELLIAHGIAEARRITSDRAEWDAAVGEEALEEVRLALRNRVTYDWTENRVEEEVADILEAWE